MCWGERSFCHVANILCLILMQKLCEKLMLIVASVIKVTLKGKTIQLCFLAVVMMHKKKKLFSFSPSDNMEIDTSIYSLFRIC